MSDFYEKEKELSREEREKILIRELDCKNCKYRKSGECTSPILGCTEDCPKFEINAFKIAIIVYTILQILVAIITCLLAKRIWIFMIVFIPFNILLFLLGGLFIDTTEKILVNRSKRIQTKKHKKKLGKKEVQRENDFENFKNHIQEVYQKLNSFKELISIPNNANTVNHTLDTLIQKMNKFIEKIDYNNFDNKNVQIFWNGFVMDLIKNMNDFTKLSQRNQLNEKQIQAFNTLLINFCKKADQCYEILEMQDSDDFVKRMQKLSSDLESNQNQ